MEWLELLKEIMQVCFVPMMGVLTAFIVDLIITKRDELNRKSENEIVNRYINLASDTIISCVQETNQTYVNALKDKDLFDAEAQKEAFKRTYENVLAVLGEKGQKILGLIYGDLNTFLVTSIESTVNRLK